MEKRAIVEVWGVTREFRVGGGVVRAVHDAELRIAAGEMVALSGRSGAGKTTLLNIVAGLDSPTSGHVLVLGHDLAALSASARARIRRENIGVMFQNAHLFPLLTARENVEVMLRIQRRSAAFRREHALRALDLVGLRARAHHRGLELSGGEQQRVALARALVHSPRLLVADEPTGNLDSRTGRDVAELLRATAHEQQVGLLVATHDDAVARAADRVLILRDGQLTQA